MTHEDEQKTTFEIAYYEEKNYHTEILGIFAEYFTNKNIKITVFNDGDKSDFVSFYQKYYGYDVKSTDQFFDNDEYKKYKYIIIGTGDESTKLDKIYENIRNRCIAVYHILENINNCCCNNIVLTPLNITSRSHNYMLPIYGTYENIDRVKCKNIYALIGRFKDGNRDTNELVSLIENNRNNNYEINIYVRHKKFVPHCLLELAKKYSNNLKIFIGIKTADLEKRLRNTKFMVSLITQDSVYHTDRLSGIIPFSYNFNIPLIIDKSTNNIYNLSSTIVYENKISEIFEKINNLSQTEYQQILEKMMEEKEKIIERNNNIMDFIFC